MKFSKILIFIFSIKALDRLNNYKEITDHGLLVIPSGHGKGLIHQDVFQDMRGNEGGRASWKQD